MDDITTSYLDTWNTTDAAQRGELLRQHWSSAARYTDPMAEVVGHEQINALVDGVHQQFPGFVFTPVGQPDAHHNQVRFQWGLGPDGAEPVVIGFDVLTLDADGRIEQVLGFLDKVPA
ncbi:nuclear transport factor 2 family protein [Calidifontibacter sp. DB0510]|uniref:Nuclear transport factor 2 family protein n=1 Tax=Metallococcus carri TaxID=1656884 RepID=A0A967B3X9_9MICO|nr:nuclear transport factor 2 family protein [Metallococcus carri]NHN57088.1 nuclear transport factor 2 family protein [Metallococcus carri]NOP39043.1 nuclear transport factor 2 family protein [Calidifontibacter sp. DB2511S]